jgi:dihydroneopterin triphosphate diphosphatase
VTEQMREPFTVLVFLFRSTADGPRYAVFRRADDANWQSVSGGMETGETLRAAARRETLEETGMPATNPLYELDMVSGVEKSCFKAAEHWPADLYIVPKHFFAMDVTTENRPISLSDEHSEFRWMSYVEAYDALRYDDDKTALWELDTRLGRDDLPAPLD